MKLKSLVLVLVSCCVLLGGSGCRLFGKSKPKKPQEAPIAASVESSFKSRWTERRTAELVAQGQEAAAARAQAEKDFHEKYAYLKDEGK